MKRKILNQATIVEKNAKDAPVKDINWDVTEAQTDGFRIEDEGAGKPIIVRSFSFKFPPNMNGRPTKAQILTPEYKNFLNNLLWADAMEQIIEPKVVFEKGGFRVFATCQAKRGNMIPDYAIGDLKPLQNKLQGK